MPGLIVLLLLLLLIGDAIGDGFGIQPNPIYFNHVPQSQAVIEGDDVSFNCSAPLIETPYNSSVFVWYHNNTEVTDGTVSLVGNDTSILHITSVTVTDQGDYYCIVKDWETRTRSLSGKLTVYGDDTLNQVHYLNVTFDGTIILDCNFDDADLPINWLMNGHPISYTDGRFQLIHDGSLVVLHVTDDDEYSCEVTISDNNITWKSYQVYAVSEEPSSEISMFPEGSTQFVENMIIICNIPAQLNIYDVQWQRNGELIDNSGGGFEISSDNMLTLTHMDVSSAEYHCIVSSVDNSSLTSPPLMVYKYSVPTIEETDTAHYICASLYNNFTCAGGAHQNVTLHCNITAGFPTPTIVWYHNGIRVVNDGSETMVMNKTACDLLGTYQCVVKNEVGTAVLVHRVLPFGQPNAPSEPQLHTEGRVVHLNWTKPTYLAGLNSSFIAYQAYYNKSIILPPVQMESSLNFTEEDLKSGSPTNYFIKLTFSEDAKHGRCQEYDIPNEIESPLSRKLDPRHIIDYGAPIVNLSCPAIVNDVDTVVHMDWLPTGNLDSQEMLRLVAKCSVQWTCNNGIEFKSKSNTFCTINGADFTIPSSWKSYNCSVNVNYKNPLKYSPSTVKQCSGIANFSTSVSSTKKPFETNSTSSTTTKYLPTETTDAMTSATTITAHYMSVRTTILIESTTFSPTQTFLLESRSTGLESTPLKGSTENTSVDSAVFAMVISSFIALIAFPIIVLSIAVYYCKKKRKGKVLRFGQHKISKPCSYVTREDQSEEPNLKVANWIKSLEAHNDTCSINSEYMSKEFMLNVVYGKEKHSGIYKGDSSDNASCYGDGSNNVGTNTTSTVHNHNNQDSIHGVCKDEANISAPTLSDFNCNSNTSSQAMSSKSGYAEISHQDCSIDISYSEVTNKTQDSFSYIALDVDNVCIASSSKCHGAMVDTDAINDYYDQQKPNVSSNVHCTT